MANRPATTKCRRFLIKVQAISSKRKRAPVLSHQRRHDNDNNDRGNTTNNTVNGGRDDYDADEFSQPFWTRAKSKAVRATTQHARNTNAWHTVRRCRDYDRRDYTPTNTTLHSSSTPCCYLCGETGHVRQNCRHGRKLQCHTCQSFGHK